MTISAVTNSASYLPSARLQPAPAVPKTAVAAVGTDSDGDNDASKGGTVDVRA